MNQNCQPKGIVQKSIGVGLYGSHGLTNGLGSACESCLQQEEYIGPSDPA